MLLETLVAFLVLAITLTAAVATISQGGLSLRRAAEAELATDVAREVAALRLDPLAVEEPQAGDLRGAAWRLELHPLGSGGRQPLYAVTIHVRPPGAARSFAFPGFAIGPPRGPAP